MVHTAYLSPPLLSSCMHLIHSRIYLGFSPDQKYFHQKHCKTDGNHDAKNWFWKTDQIVEQTLTLFQTDVQSTNIEMSKLYRPKGYSLRFIREFWSDS